MKKLFYFVASAFVVIMLCTGAFSCSNEDEPWAEEEFSTLARTKMTRSGNPNESLFGDVNCFYIPDDLINSTGCGYKAIAQVFGNRYSMDSIKKAMSYFDPNVEVYPTDKMSCAIQRLIDQPVSTITTMSSNCASVGDIVCVSPRSHNGKMMVTGHATVVSSIEQKTNYTLLNCYDGCKFDPLTLSLVIKTSNLH